MFLFPDGTLVIQLVNFAIFFAILRVVFLRPVAEAIRQRREYINGVTADYDRYQAEAKVLRDEAESIRAAARRGAEQHFASVRAKASNKAAELASQYAAQAQGVVEEATRQVQDEVDRARSNEKHVVGELADLMLERVFAEAGS